MVMAAKDRDFSRLKIDIHTCCKNTPKSVICKIQCCASFLLLISDGIRSYIPSNKSKCASFISNFLRLKNDQIYHVIYHLKACSIPCLMMGVSFS